MDNYKMSEYFESDSDNHLIYAVTTVVVVLEYFGTFNSNCPLIFLLAGFF